MFISYLLFICLLSIFYRYSYTLYLVYILIINLLLYIPLSYLYVYSLSFIYMLILYISIYAIYYLIIGV